MNTSKNYQFDQQIEILNVNQNDTTFNSRPNDSSKLKSAPNQDIVFHDQFVEIRTKPQSQQISRHKKKVIANSMYQTDFTNFSRYPKNHFNFKSACFTPEQVKHYEYDFKQEVQPNMYTLGMKPVNVLPWEFMHSYNHRLSVPVMSTSPPEKKGVD